MGKGWVKRYRKLKEWEWYKTKDMAHFFMHLISEANYEDKLWKGKTPVKRGSFITSRHTLSYETGLSERAVRTCLERLKSTGEVTIKTTKLYSVITLCNYKAYNSQENQNDQVNDQQNDQARVLKTTSRTTTTKELKNLKKTIDSSIILNTPPSPPKGSSVFQEEEFRDIILSVEIQQNSKLFDTLLEFYHHRKWMKAPLTKNATTKVLNKLKKISTTEAMSIEILEESIMNNWKGIFPQGSNNQAKAAPKSFKQQDADNKMAQLQKMYERRQHDEEGA